MSQWTLGDITIDRVVEFQEPVFPPEAMYPQATKSAIDAHRSWLEPRLLDPANGLLIFSFHTFVIRTGGRTILIDTCGGNDKPRPGKPRYHLKRWPYPERLAAVGVKREDVDMVVCTHLHVDHVGWNTHLVGGRWLPTFPHARYVFVRKEWEFWREEYKTERFTGDPYYEDSIVPIFDAGLVVSADGRSRENTEIGSPPTPSDNVPSPMPIGRRDRCWDWRTS